MEVTTVSFDLINKIFLFINRTENQAILLSHRQKWYRLTSSLRVLEDTSWAIEYYLQSQYPTDYKGKYLYTYGLLQALFLQMDAANSLNQALFEKKINYKDEYPAAYAIREIRNDVTGHPTNRGGNDFIYLAQHSLSRGSFYYSKDNADSECCNIIDVNVLSAVSETASCINTILGGIILELDSEWIDYINKHRGRKMEEIFKQLNYAKEKALSDDYMSEWGYNATKDMISKCEEELKLRYGSVEAVDCYKYLIAEIYDIYSLIDEETADLSPCTQQKVHFYLKQLLFSKLEELEQCCKETDDYFLHYGEEITFSEQADTVTIVIEE